MTVEQFTSYDFHDSVINAIEVSSDSVLFLIDFCQWRQKYYEKYDSEVVNRFINFVEAKIVADDNLLSKLSSGSDASILSVNAFYNKIEFMVELNDYSDGLPSFHKIEIHNPGEIIFNP